jgi:hypothetical protein
VSLPAMVKGEASITAAYAEQRKRQFAKELEEERVELADIIKELEDDLRWIQGLDEYAECDKYNLRLTPISDKFASTADQLDNLRRKEELCDVPQTETANFKQVQGDFELFYSLWQLVLNVQSQAMETTERPIVELDP